VGGAAGCAASGDRKTLGNATGQARRRGDRETGRRGRSWAPGTAVHAW
jgi:hypothetical protein